MDWRGRLNEMLIDAGVSGLKQKQITFRFRDHATAEMLLEHLEALRYYKKVQRFTVHPKTGRPAHIWRATSLMLESDDDSTIKQDDTDPAERPED